MEGGREGEGGGREGEGGEREGGRQADLAVCASSMPVLLGFSPQQRPPKYNTPPPPRFPRSTAFLL